MQINRRDFLKFGGGAVAGTALSAAGAKFIRNLAYGEGELVLGAGEETWSTSDSSLDSSTILVPFVIMDSSGSASMTWKA